MSERLGFTIETMVERDALKAELARLTRENEVIWEQLNLARGICDGYKTANAAQAEQIERLTRERDTLVERWPDETNGQSLMFRYYGKWLVWGKLGSNGCYQSKFLEDRAEAVRFAAGLGEEGENVP